MKKYEVPELRLIELDETEIVTASACPDDSGCPQDNNFCDSDWDTVFS